MDVTVSLRSWNPIKANFVVYQELVTDAINPRRWQGKLGLWFRPTGWRPADVQQNPIAKREENYKKYDAAPKPKVSLYLAVQFVLVVLLGFAFLMATAELGSPEIIALLGFFIWQIYMFGKVIGRA